MTAPTVIIVPSGDAWEFSDDVFHIRCYLFRSSWETMRTALNTRGWGIDPRDRMSLGTTLTHKNEVGAYHQAIWLPEDWDIADAECLGTLVHECQHVTFKGLIHRGVCANQDDHETFCYYIGSLFERCFELLRNHHGR